MVLSLSCASAGLIIYTHYQFCDPKLTGQITNDDQVGESYTITIWNFFEHNKDKFLDGRYVENLLNLVLIIQNKIYFRNIDLPKTCLCCVFYNFKPQ